MRRFAFGVVIAVLAICILTGTAFAAAAQLGEGQAVGSTAVQEAGGEELGEGQAVEPEEEVESAPAPPVKEKEEPEKEEEVEKKEEAEDRQPQAPPRGSQAEGQARQRNRRA